MTEKPNKGIAVDAFCKGNPGPGGYQGVDLETGEKLFSNFHLGECTNNIAEFIGLVHALMYMKKNRKYDNVWTDSEVAIAWVKNKSCTTTFFTGDKKELAHKIWKCEHWLVQEKTIRGYQHWKTKAWGEIPADFGNKK